MLSVRTHIYEFEEENHICHDHHFHPSFEECSEVSLSCDSDDQIWHSPFGSVAGVHQYSEDVEVISEDHLECEGVKVKVVHELSESSTKRDCRICHLGLGDSEEEGLDSGIAIQLSCSCKGDLGSAHMHCAETWFQMKGDTNCEICGVPALNIGVVENASEANSTTSPMATTALPPPHAVETICNGHRLMNILLACLVLAFIISWLFHFKVI